MAAFLVVIMMSRGADGEMSKVELLSILGVAALVVAYPAFLLIPYLKYKSAIVRVTPEGLIDLRKGPEPLPWERIEFADVKRQIFGTAVRVQLVDGTRFDVDFHLLEGRAEQCFLAMQEYLYASKPYRNDDYDDEEEA